MKQGKRATHEMQKRLYRDEPSHLVVNVSPSHPTANIPSYVSVSAFFCLNYLVHSFSETSRCSLDQPCGRTTAALTSVHDSSVRANQQECAPALDLRRLHCAWQRWERPGTHCSKRTALSWGLILDSCFLEVSYVQEHIKEEFTE